MKLFEIPMVVTSLLGFCLLPDPQVPTAGADFTFGKPQNLGPVINIKAPWNNSSCCTSADNLELFFASDRPGGFGGFDLYVSTRQSVNDPWGPPVNLGATVNSPYNEMYPSLSADGLTLYFCDFYSGSPRPGGLGDADIWMTTRATRSAPWTTPVNIGAPINSSASEFSPSVSADGLILVFTSANRAGTRGAADLWISTRASVQAPWAVPVNLGPNVNSDSTDLEGSLSADGLALFFPSARAGQFDLWMTTRKSRNDPWGQAVSCGPVVNSSGTEGCAGVSPDGRTLYFGSNREGSSGWDIYAAPIMPVVDFNGDLKVDIQDLLILIEHWGQDYPLCDIGPMPWGDGKVDGNDLEVLMSYWGQEVPDPNLVAHWKLDETEGTVAQDSARSNDATLKGDPIWQPAGGKVDGALQLDGIDDYLQTPFVLNPSQGAFSVLAWVKGGTPGQVILSQIGKADWLSTDAKAGSLITELKAQGSLGTPLQSQSVVTDGNWHRVGLVWDGTNRLLYVDDEEVARDTQPSLPDSSPGLYVGVGNKRGKATYWSGLIDDVRIYDRAITP